MKYTQLISLYIILSMAGCKDNQEVKPLRKEIVDAVFGSGYLANRDQYIVMASTDGYLEDVLIAEDDSIKSGQLLFKINNDMQQAQTENALIRLKYARANTVSGSPQIEQLNLQLLQSRANVNVDSLNYKRYERLQKTNAVSRMDYETAKLKYQESSSALKVLRSSLADLQSNLNLRLENAKATYRIEQQNNNFYAITGKANGVVLSVAREIGDYIKKGDALAQIGAGQPVIKLYIAEDDIQYVEEGQTALISLNSVKDKVFKAIVTKKYPVFDKEQQAFVVEAAFKDHVAELINGTQLQGNIIIHKKNNALVIPSSYLIDGNFVKIKNSKENKSVKTGIRTLEWTEILSGLTETDILVSPEEN